MAGGDASRSRDRGGGRIQASRVRWPRLIRAAGSLACAGAVAAYPAAAAARVPWLHAGLGIAAFAALAAGLALRRSTLFVWALVVLGADYALWLELGTHALDQRAPIVGGGLLLAAELAYDSLEPEVGRPESTAVLARVIVLAGVTLGAIGVGALVLATASIPLSGGAGLTAVGVAAAVLVLAVITRLAAEHRLPPWP
jgi:hypothetical protein